MTWVPTNLDGFGRLICYGQGRVKETTPCEYVDLTQRHVEPLLLRYASHHNFRHRFSTELIGVEPISDDLGTGYLCAVQDHITNHHSKIRTRYLFGADWAPWSDREVEVERASYVTSASICTEEIFGANFEMMVGYVILNST